MAKDITNGLANELKAKLLAGRDFWSTYRIKGKGRRSIVPSAVLTDGPNGVRKQEGSFDNMGLGQSVPSTCFPCSCVSACSFDEKLMQMVGRAIGEECRREGVAVNLGPGINIKRHPLGGRNFEYFSEDPLLAGKMGAAYIRGVQSTGVGACVKHFAANNQELGRMISDSVIDERTLNDIYLRGFKIAVQEGRPASIMMAYNKLNGTYCAQNAELISKLRGEWGFEGAVMTDWGAMSQSVPSVAAGLDLCMPGPRPDHAHAVLHAVEQGELPQQALDRAAEKAARLAVEHTWDPSEQEPPFTCDYIDHLAIAQLMAEAGAVLLKNDPPRAGAESTVVAAGAGASGSGAAGAVSAAGVAGAASTAATAGAVPVLPLNRSQKVALIGGFARTPRYQGSGSSRINPIELDNALAAFREADWNVDYAAGYDVQTGQTTEALLEQAKMTAAAADVAVVFVGLPDSFESEGFDRADMKLPSGMNALVTRVAGANPNTVVVVSGGGPVQLPWRESVPAIMAMYLAGCQGGHALFNLLTGVANPSGKLAETWPETLQDTALKDSFPCQERQVPYIEGPFVGYRYYDSAKVKPAYCFGHGLSYTTFHFSDLGIKKQKGAYLVECTVSNTGARDGAQVVQVYVAAKKPAVPMPKQQLVAFAKPFIKAGESVRVRFELGPEAFQYWDAQAHKPRIDAGKYKVHVCASSRDVHLKGVVDLADDAPFKVSKRPQVSDERQQALRAYYHVGRHSFSAESFRELYGRPLPPITPVHPYTPDSPMKDLKESALGRIIYRIASSAAAMQGTDSDEASAALVKRMFDDMPLRAATMGGVRYGLICKLCEILNKH